MTNDVLQAIDPTGAMASHRTMSTGKRNFDALTGLRFFAAVAVVFYHFASVLSTSWAAPLTNLVNSGFVAVSFFYVLSGFVLSYSYIGRGGETQGSKRSFWVARLARIYPAYLLAFLLAAPTNIVWSLNVNSFSAGVTKLAVGAISVLTLQQAWTPWSAWYWNYPGWSVSVEAFFYLAFPFLALAIRRIQKRYLIVTMCGLWLAGLVIPALVVAGHHAPAGVSDRLAMAVEFTPLLRLPEFLIGMLLARLYVQGVRLNLRASAAATYLAVASIIIVLALLSPSIPRLVLSNGLLVPLFALLILGLADGKTLLSRALAWSPLVLLGEASYGMYILQIPVSYVLRSPPPMRSFAAVFTYLIILTAVALLSWRFVEAPLRVQIRRWLLRTGKTQRKPTEPRGQMNGFARAQHISR